MTGNATQEAKSYLIAELLAEAALEGVSFAEVERKMLYFTETAESLPDIMEVSDAFDRDYNQPEYESKVASLARNARLRDPIAWDRAVQALKSEDHYLLVCIDPKNILSTAGIPSPTVVADRLKLAATAFAICVVLFAVLYFLANRHLTP